MEERTMFLKGGSPALHLLGDLSRQYDDFICVYDEDDDYYIGCFEEGFGFVDVKFAKNDVRPLTQEEVDDMNRRWYCINGQPMLKIHIDENGYRVKKDKI